METAVSGQKDKNRSNDSSLQIPKELVQKKNSQAIASSSNHDPMHSEERSMRASGNRKVVRDIDAGDVQSAGHANNLTSKPYENQKPSTANAADFKTSPQKKRRNSRQTADDIGSGRRQIESYRQEDNNGLSVGDKERSTRRYQDLLKPAKPQFSFANKRALHVDIAETAIVKAAEPPREEEKILSSSRISNSSNFSALSGNSNRSIGSEACRNQKQFQSSSNLHPLNQRITPHQPDSAVGPYGFGRTQLAASTNMRVAEMGDGETFDGSSPLVPRDLDSATDEGAPARRPVMTQDDKSPLLRSKTIRKVESGIPEAMPLIMRISNHNSKEPDLYQKLRRGTTFMQGGGPGGGLAEPESFCAHEGLIEQWKCVECKAAISKFNICFDNVEGKVNPNTKIVFENSFLSDFKHEFRAQATQAYSGGEKKSQIVIYQCYQPSNILELKEYIFMLMCKRVQKVNKAAGDDGKKMSPFGSGTYQNLSSRLTRYLIQHDERQKRLRQQYGSEILLFDSLFESGNLLQAEKNATAPDTYNLFMQVDTNTRGHQQWFHFRAKGGKKGKEYTFYIMNFTKPGVSGGRGYKLGEHDMRIVVRSKRKQIQLNDFEKWEDLTNNAAQCAYVKTNVARRKKDVIAAGADSDQEEWIEEAFNQQRNVAASTTADKQQLPVISIDGPGQGQARPGAETANMKAANEPKQKRRRVFYYYALRFKYKFEHDNDTVYFAFSRPITYTDILEDLHRKERLLCPKGHGGVAVAPAPALLMPPKKPPLSKQLSMKPRADKSDQASEKGASLVANKNKEPATAEKADKMSHANAEQMNQQYDKLVKHQFKSDILIENSNQNIYYKRTQFCSTITGLPLFKIVIGRDQRSVKNNSIVLITSRVHSGETPGSEVFRGIYNFITSDSREAKYLRRFYTFILIPCMNPDGVVCGNYRNSTAGVDLNRQWINPEPEYHPEVCGVKHLMQEIKEEDKRQIWIFCDLHGHSKKKNSFFYGCNTAANGGFLSWTIVRLLPRIFAQKTHMFNYKDCRFRVEPYKIGTARIVAWKQFSITHSFTLENSFYGYDIGEDESRIFTQEDYQNVGLKFMLSIYDMHSLWKQIRRELQITHGWLKPRTLNEMTGVPAAQILAQEAAQQKEDERKRKAIEQYEEFLKTFYKSRGGFKRPVTTVDKKIMNKDKKEDGAAPVRRRKARHGADGEVNKDLELLEADDDVDNQLKDEDEGNQQLERVDEDTAEAEEESDEEYFLKMHNGLIKIQALIRGFIDRQRVKKLVQSKQNRMLNKMISHSNSRSNIAGEQSGIKRQRSNQVLANSSAKRLKLGRHNAPSQANLPGGTKTRGGAGVNRQGYDTSSDGGAKATAGGTTQLNNAFGDSSNDDQLMRSNTEQLQPQQNLSDSGVMTNKSIETPGGGLFGSMSLFGWSRKTNMLGAGGSNNQKPQLAWRDFFEGDELDRAYQIVEVEQRDETDGEGSGDASMGSDSDPSGDNLDEEEVYRDVYGVKNPERLIEQKKQREQEFIEKVQTDVGATQVDLMNKLLNREGTPDLRALNDQSLDAELLGGDDDAKDLDDKNNEADDEGGPQTNDKPQTPRLADTAPLPSASRQDNSQNGSPSNGRENADASGNKKNENMLNSMSQNARRLLKSGNQQRALTQQGNVGQLANSSSMNQQLANGGVGAARLVQQSFYMMRQKCQMNGKKQNINQVIKDCFIIKKVGSRGLQGQKEGGKTRGQSRTKESAQHRGARRVVGKILQGANGQSQGSAEKAASHSPDKRDMLMNMMLLQQQNAGVAPNAQSQPTSTASSAEHQAFQQLSLLQKQQIYYQNVMLHQQRQAMLDQQAQAQTAARMQSSTGNLPPQPPSAPMSLHTSQSEKRKKLPPGLHQQASLLLGSGYDAQGRPSQPQNRILNEAQAQQLIDQLNAAMKNMTQSQAIQFLKMIQDKNVYFQLATDPKRQQTQPKPRSNAPPVHDLYGANQTASNYHKYHQLQLADDLHVEEHSKMLKTFNNVATSHLQRPESHSANKALSSAKNTLEHPRAPGHDPHHLMSQSAMHVGYPRQGLKPSHDTQSHEDQLRTPAIGQAHQQHYYSGKDQYGAPLLASEQQRKFGATAATKMMPLVVEQMPGGHQALSQSKLGIGTHAGSTLRDNLRGTMPQVHAAQSMVGKPPSASRALRPAGPAGKSELMTAWAGSGHHQQVDNYMAQHPQDSRRLQMPQLASVQQYSHHQTATPSQQSAQMLPYTSHGRPQAGAQADLTRTFYAQKVSTHAPSGASQPDAHSILLAPSVHGAQQPEMVARGPGQSHHKQSVSSSTQPNQGKAFMGSMLVPEYENQGGSSLFMKYVKKKATLQNVNLSQSGAAMLADSSEQLAPFQVNPSTGNVAQSSGPTVLAPNIKMIKAQKVATQQSLARIGGAPSGTGYSKAQLFVDRERRDRLREARSGEHD